mmetsp:Transcript_91214/g.295029  ORF Transcript_91214/g.295029 Transcript_91214/m.295029 type:complete len:244 (-) Transcript_91214:394-1125(-)
MKPVLRLVKHDGLWAINDLRGLFHAPGGRQTVHERAVGLCELHQLGSHLERHEQLLSRFLLVLGDAITHPAIAIDGVHASHGLLRRLEDLHLAPRLLLELADLLPDLLLDAAGPRKVQGEAHQRRGAHEVVRHVVLEVAKVCHLQPLPSALVLYDGEEVRKHLHGMPVIVECIDDGDRGDLCERPDRVPAEHPRGDALAHPREHPAGVLHALLHTQGGVTDGVENCVPPQLVHAHLQGHARAQ